MWRRIISITSCLFLFAVSLSAQTSGTLSVSVSTAQTSTPTYAPRNIIAIWIEDNSGKFVKTLLAYANTRKTHLNTWEASTTTAGSAFNVVDATTGATQSSHGTRTAQWNGTDFSGKLVSDGNFNLKMELTDHNGTGNIATFAFTKGTTAQKLTPADVPSFKSVSISWTTGVTGNRPELTQNNTVVIYPNPSSGVFTILGDDIGDVEVSSLSGNVVSFSRGPVIDLTEKPKGIYFAKIKAGAEVFVRKIIRN